MFCSAMPLQELRLYNMGIYTYPPPGIFRVNGFDLATWTYR
jgi:hypothetical protein